MVAGFSGSKVNILEKSFPSQFLASALQYQMAFKIFFYSLRFQK
jgi:hypothetical protein